MHGDGLPDDLPKKFVEENEQFTFIPAEPLKEAVFDKPFQVGGLKASQLEARWGSTQDKVNKLRQSVAEHDPGTVVALAEGDDAPDGELVWSASVDRGDIVTLPPGYEPQQNRAPTRLIGIHGRAGSGKTTVAEMIPGATVIQLADPIYAMLECCLGVHEKWLRRPAMKAREIPWIGKSPRQLLQTLGTEWGRRMVCDDFWIKILGFRIMALQRSGASVIAVADVRFENEAEFLRSVGGEIWHILRPGTDQPNAHVSEAGIAIRDGDHVIDNNGTLDDLKAQVETAFDAEGRA